MSDWVLAEEVMDPKAAFGEIDAGADWLFHRCTGGVLRSSAGHAEAILDQARRECITEAERQSLVARGQRGKIVPTVVLAERWVDVDGCVLVVFREAGPQRIPARRRPDRLGAMRR